MKVSELLLAVLEETGNKQAWVETVFPPCSANLWFNIMSKLAQGEFALSLVDDDQAKRHRSLESYPGARRRLQEDSCVHPRCIHVHILSACS